MTDAVVGTGGPAPAGPRTGVPAHTQAGPHQLGGGDGSNQPSPAGTARWGQRLRRLYLTLVVIGSALSLIAVGMGAQRFLDRTPVMVASAAADPQAGDLIDRSIGGADTSSTATAAPATADPQPAVPGIRIPGAIAPSLAAADPHAAPATAVHIPRLGLNQSLVGQHNLPDQSLSVPQSFADVGWWSSGPRPGAPGAMVVAGHVSSKSGPAVFWALKDLRPGDRITVDRADHSSATFQVVGKASYPRSSFPDDVVYRTSGKPSIHLITCDGAFDPAIGHHQDNLIVFADLIPTAHPKGTHPATTHHRGITRQRPKPPASTSPSSQPTRAAPTQPDLVCTSDIVCRPDPTPKEHR